MSNPIFLGIDIGTSGIRASGIDADAQQLVQHEIAFKTPLAEQHNPEPGSNEQDPALWLSLLDKLLTEIADRVHKLDGDFQISAIAIDGTSSTLIACKKDGTAISPALMYNDSQSRKQAEIISRFAPAETAVHSASSSLAKALNLMERFPDTELFCHQADWLAASLTGTYCISDENNCLKLGYDSVKQTWPDWLFKNDQNAVLTESLLPRVVAPGSKIGNVLPDLIKQYSLDKNCIVVAGTTDSNAAVLATGANQLGDAITSLGSTLVIKLFSDKPLFNPEYGIYSHRLNDHWLVGGASNTGGATLLQQFTPSQLDEMTPLLKPEQPTGLDYYPLPGTGERFPVNDSHKQSKITPRPDSAVEFFQGLLEGIANIEAEAYKKLTQLGAGKPARIFTAGGGNKNPAWKKIRQRVIGVKVRDAVHSEACYGSALLALRAMKNEK
jgi:sugar (pentulose or hexulose) kinase